MPGPSGPPGLSRLDPAVAATRVAVRRSLADVPADRLVLVACSGGADSLALAAATVFELARAGNPAAAVVVDHGLQQGSAQVAQRAADVCQGLGMHPVQVCRVRIDPGLPGGPEARARTARHAALAEAAAELGATSVLLGHTRDDQAETVLLRLARGSGTRALAAMAPDGPGLLRRPFVASVTRAQTRAACTALGLRWWDDPHNEDPAYARVRARKALAVLSTQLGHGLVDGLVRSAELARQDADHLDAAATQAADRLGTPPWPVADLAALPDAVRTRVWRVLAARSGAAAADVGGVHVAWLDALVSSWRGQGPVDVPGGIRVCRRAGLIHIDGADAPA